MVAHQRVLIAIAATIPTTVQDLKRIKGVGGVFIDKYGAEVLDIVKDHSGSKNLF